MRSLLMFDLPTLTAKNRRDYRHFVKMLKRNGFIQFQESIYVKLSMNDSAAKAMCDTIKNNIPPDGLVSMLTVTENQFSKIDFLLGSFETDIVNSDQRVVEL